MSINTNLIKQTWVNLSKGPLVNNIPPLVAFAATFYDTLFQEHPEYKQKFFAESDMAVSDSSKFIFNNSFLRNKEKN